MPKKTIYVRESDMPLWEEAEKLGGNVSGLIADALRRYVEEEKRRKETGMKMIEVDVSGHPASQRVRFEGRWLVEPDQDRTRPDDPAGEDGFYYGVALTKRGKIAVYIDNANWPSKDARLDTYPSLDGAVVEGGLPEEIYERAEAAMMDLDYIAEWDI